MDYKKLMEERNQGNSFANFVGIKTTVIEQGYAEGELYLREEHLNSHGMVHGGCLFSLADTVAGSAAKTRGKGTLTLSGDLKYLLPTKNILSLLGIAREMKEGRYVNVYEVKIYDNLRQLVAMGNFEFFKEP
ncbi:MAG: PaaI family thioesterase [Tissierellia bacterium]|nr:PaaI family thioesterase [Tissierellia bacterium]